MLLKKILDAQREITHDPKHNNINMFCMRKIKSSAFTARDVKLNFRNKKSPHASSISVLQNYSLCSHFYLKTETAVNGFTCFCARITLSLVFLITWHDQSFKEREENILILMMTIWTKPNDKEVLLLEKKKFDVEKEIYMMVTIRTLISLPVKDKK